jgi:hypothetical protein
MKIREAILGIALLLMMVSVIPISLQCFAISGDQFLIHLDDPLCTSYVYMKNVHRWGCARVEAITVDPTVSIVALIVMVFSIFTIYKLTKEFPVKIWKLLYIPIFFFFFMTSMGRIATILSDRVTSLYGLISVPIIVCGVISFVLMASLKNPSK